VVRHERAIHGGIKDAHILARASRVISRVRSALGAWRIMFLLAHGALPQQQRRGAG